MNANGNWTLRGLGLLGAGLVVGNITAPSASLAEPPAIRQVSAAAPVAPPVPAAERRVVGYIYGNVPLYRDEFGEYLITRKGGEKFDLFVNKRIIEAAAAKRNITVSDAEIETVIEQDCGNLADKSRFLKMVTQQYGYSIYEWKEDVIKPRIVLYKMGKDRIDGIKIDPKEIQARYDAIHGTKVKVKIIVWPAQEEAIALKQYESIRKSEEEFDRAARKQVDSNLAAKSGEVLPFAKGTTGDERLETEAFKLKPGEISAILKINGNVMVLRCQGFEEGIKGDFEKEKPGIEKWIRERKIEAEVPKIMAALQEEAKPQKFFNPPLKTEKELKKATEEELKESGLLDEKK